MRFVHHVRTARAGVALLVLVCVSVSQAGGSEEFFDRLDEALTMSTDDGGTRGRISGVFDAEGYFFEQPSPGLIFAEGKRLFAPRLSLFLDAQLGRRVYAFAQARVDRGFDPSDEDARFRMDEYALRVALVENGRCTLQVGKFATVVGNWLSRHDSWNNPLVSAPLPYEQLTGIWDGAAAASPDTLLRWAHVPPNVFRGNVHADKYLRLPVIWGPSYATGASVAGGWGKFEYAVEAKNAALSSRPESWDPNREQWRAPTISGRIGYRPDPRWNFGVSASSGGYLLPSARGTLAPGSALRDYRQTVIAHDISFARHHWQVWAEVFASRFENPRVGDADVVAYYVEAKYRFSSGFFGAVRWNQEMFSRVRDGAGVLTRWSNDVSRIDVAAGHRFTAQMQLKVQYSLKQESGTWDRSNHLLAFQLTQRF